MGRGIWLPIRRATVGLRTRILGLGMGRNLILGDDWRNIALIVIVPGAFERLLVILPVLTLDIASR